MSQLFVYDWDDNIIKMPTKIILFSKKGVLRLSTHQFARLRSHIGSDYLIKIKGKILNLKDYYLIYENEESFSEFRDKEDGLFLRQLRDAKVGPMLHDFISKVNQGEKVFILTARGNSPETISKGVEFLTGKAIPLDNIFPISHKNFNGDPKNPEVSKWFYFQEIIDKHPNIKDIYFSDDDLKTILHFKNKSKSTKRKIELIYTGK